MTKFLFAVALIITAGQAFEFYKAGDFASTGIFIGCSIIFLLRILFGK